MFLSVKDMFAHVFLIAAAIVAVRTAVRFEPKVNATVPLHLALM